MKTLKKLAIASLIFTTISCEKENNVLSQSSSESNVQQEIPVDDLVKLQAMGYDAADIYVSADGKSYLVETDIVVRKEYLDSEKEVTKLAKKGKWWKNHPLACWVVEDVKIYQDGLPDYLASALEVAVQRWNSVPGSRVNISYVEKNQQDITVYGVTGEQFQAEYPHVENATQRVKGDAEQPFWNRPGKRIRVNTWASAEWEFWVIFMMHELGHCLGLAHTDSSNRGRSEDSNFWAEQIEGTSTDFGFSVMRSDPSSIGAAVFSDNDVESIQKLYGWDDNDNICY